jgi:hypothetical protein
MFAVFPIYGVNAVVAKDSSCAKTRISAAANLIAKDRPLIDATSL